MVWSAGGIPLEGFMSRSSVLLSSVCALVLLVPGVVVGGDIIDLPPSTTGISLVQGASVDGSTVILEVGEVSISSVKIEGANWAVVRVPGGTLTMERGFPSLPMLHAEYLLGARDGIRLELASVETRTIDLTLMGLAGVAPSKGHFDRSTDPDSVPWVFDSTVYDDGKTYPAWKQKVSEPFIAGPVRGQSMSIPVAFWSAGNNLLEVVVRARFTVQWVENDANPRLGAVQPMTPVFNAGLEGRAINTSRMRTPTAVPGRLLFIVHDDFLDEVQPLIDWERLVGYDPIVEVTSGIASPLTATAIKATVQSYYDQSDGLAWIILVGDYPQIPNFSGGNEGADCDACYTYLEGSDYRPDAAISRLSGQTGAQIQTQVNKILNYERYPDTTSGSAGWYSAAFGIGGDDNGGTGADDWERIEWLRDDLVVAALDPNAPFYTYDEFTEIYHDGTSDTVVANAVNDGRALGLYIGHGSTTSWSTTGFNNADVHNLTNGDMLPTIWSVACVNGNFRSTECFGEAWLLEESGGAVSFEGATTNESWVPPCNAQRGIVDSIRLETAFTTGAQHMAGKMEIQDTDGATQSSEGTKWVEQSTLFGSAVTWFRSLPARAIDAPEDFTVAGGEASLTVSVAGAPLALEGAAVVNFIQRTGPDTFVSVGSGLIDASGVVRAAVSGDPTHCHIHGFNLLPAEFELAAQDDGRISLGGQVFGCGDLVAVRVSDANIPGASPVSMDTVAVTVEVVGGGSLQVTLTETQADNGIYAGDFTLGTDLVAAHGDTIRATYVDQVTGSGGSATLTADATMDCQGPAISAVNAVSTEGSATITFTTSEPGTTTVTYGQGTPVTVISDSVLTTDHTVTITGLDSCSTYRFFVTSMDARGNQTVDTNGGGNYAFDTAGWTLFISESLNADPGWAIENGSHQSDGWAFGDPTGSGQDTHGNPDPDNGINGDFVYGVNLAGDAPASLGDNELTLTTKTVDLSDATSAQLRYMRWLGVEQPYYDHARIQLSIDDGASWTTVWENEETIDDGAWVEHVVPLPDAVGQSAVKVRWTYGTTDGSWNFAGWNIDEIVIEGASPCEMSDPVFGDGFEVGSCDNWSHEENGL
jgi:hypothetical protein